MYTPLPWVGWMPPAAPTESLHGFLPFMRLILHAPDCLSFSIEFAAFDGVSLPQRIGLTTPIHADCGEWMESKVRIWHRISETLRVKMPLKNPGSRCLESVQ